ncbi:MAG TPA: arylesterase [Candidatus Binatia bacterium]|jgi:acyl-CoA thioesterase-1|nr:arylesterase [Candidatus Binatia bacterium]
MTRLARIVFFFCAISFSVSALAADTGSIQDTTNSSSDAKVILFFGDSLTAGYGLEPSLAFPALIQEKINSLGWNFRVINAGVSGETTAGGLRRINRVLQRPVDVFVLELGANDGLRGLPVEEVKQNLQAIIDQVKNTYPEVKVVLAGMQVLSNLGRDYTTRFRTIFPELAAANNATLIPFLLEGVGGIRELNLPDGIHPTPAGQKIVAENVWKVLEPVLKATQ